MKFGNFEIVFNQPRVELTDKFKFEELETESKDIIPLRQYGEGTTYIKMGDPEGETRFCIRNVL